VNVGPIVGALCAITSLTCAVLLLRGFVRTRARLLLWSGLCFVGLFINNALLVLDDRLASDLTLVRTYPAFIGVALLVYGLIWESER
jgi:hypothetical protein